MSLDMLVRYTDANGRRDTKATRSTADKFDGKCRCYFCTNKINAKWSNLPKNKFAEQNIKDAIPHFQELKLFIHNPGSAQQIKVKPVKYWSSSPYERSLQMGSYCINQKI